MAKKKITIEYEIDYDDVVGFNHVCSSECPFYSMGVGNCAKIKCQCMDIENAKLLNVSITDI